MVGRVVGSGDQRALASVDFHEVAAVHPGVAGDVGGGDCAVFETAADQDVVGGGYVNHLIGVGLEPLGGLGADNSGDVAEIADDHAEDVDGVAEGDGEGVCAEFAVALPGAVGLALERPAGDTADVAGHDLADVAIGDQILEVQQGGVGAGLEADHVADAGGLGEIGHLLRLGGGASQGPLGVDVLAGVDGGNCRLVVAGHAQTDGHGVDVGVGQHLVVVIEGEACAERLAGLLGALHAGGADGGQLELGAGDDGGQVGTDGPAAMDVGADDAQANFVGHDDAPAVDLGHRSTADRGELSWMHRIDRMAIACPGQSYLRGSSERINIRPPHRTRLLG